MKSSIYLLRFENLCVKKNYLQVNKTVIIHLAVPVSIERRKKLLIRYCWMLMVFYFTNYMSCIYINTFAILLRVNAFFKLPKKKNFQNIILESNWFPFFASLLLRAGVVFGGKMCVLSACLVQHYFTYNSVWFYAFNTALCGKIGQM